MRSGWTAGAPTPGALQISFCTLRRTRISGDESQFSYCKPMGLSLRDIDMQASNSPDQHK